MGLWDHFVAVGAVGVGARAIPAARLLAERDGWTFARLPMDGSVETGETVAAVAREFEAAAVGGFVADSDAAALYFSDPVGATGWLAINPSYDDSDESHTAQWLDPDAHRQAADELADWAKSHAPRSPTGEEIVAALTALEDEEMRIEYQERALVFAEDGLRTVFQDLLGLPSLDEVVFSVE